MIEMVGGSRDLIHVFGNCRLDLARLKDVARLHLCLHLIIFSKLQKGTLVLLKFTLFTSFDSYTNKAISQEVGYDIYRRFLLDCRRPGNTYFKILLVASVVQTFSSLILSFHCLFSQAKLREENPRNALLEVSSYSNSQHLDCFHLFFSFIMSIWFLVCFQYRGNAGSHDLPFSVETLESLTKLTKEG